MEIVFILVEPSVPENTGAAARALNTMGFNRLRIVNPGHDPLRGKSRIVAHGSFGILEKAEIFNSLKEAVADLDFIIGTSAKKRRTREEYLKSGDLREFLKSREYLNHTGIIFGREESGLTNEEIGLCDIISNVPLSKPYPSLNLSHAVMIYAYELSANQPKMKPGSQPVIADENLKALKAKVGKILEIMEMNNLSAIGPRIYERMSYLQEVDIHILHSITAAFLEKYGD